MAEAGRATRFLKSYARADRRNLGALANTVRQLHLYVVALIISDPDAQGRGVWRGEAV
jgi:hypothetical protein